MSLKNTRENNLATKTFLFIINIINIISLRASIFVINVMYQFFTVLNSHLPFEIIKKKK
jgi:hypothetical protein